MTTIEEQLFLSDEIEDVSRHIRTKYSGWFDLSQLVNKSCMDHFVSLRGIEIEKDGLLVMPLFLRGLETFNTAVLLAQRGAQVQAKMLLRNQIDALFPLVAITNDSSGSYAKEYADQDIKTRHKLANNAGLLETATDNDIQESEVVKKEMDEIIKDENINTIKRFQWAERAGLLDLYRSKYTLLCDDTHSSVRSLETHVDSDGKIFNGFQGGPNEDDIEITLLTSIHVMITAMKAQNKHFSLNKEDNITELELMLNRLTKDYQIKL